MNRWGGSGVRAIGAGDWPGIQSDGTSNAGSPTDGMSSAGSEGGSLGNGLRGIRDNPAKQHNGGNRKGAVHAHSIPRAFWI